MGIYPGRRGDLLDGDGRKTGPSVAVIPSFLKHLRVDDMANSWDCMRYKLPHLQLPRNGKPSTSPLLATITPQIVNI